MYQFICGDSLTELRKMESESVNMCVTSPPYFNLRDYGNENQIGLEETPEQYIEKLVAVFREVKRVLKNDGTLWVNIADSYAGSGKGAATHPKNAAKYKQGTNKGTVGAYKTSKPRAGGDYIKPKDLIGIPWMLAFALRADGWYLRQDIIWDKSGNCFPESVKDRCTKAHEYIFLLSKQQTYYFNSDAIKEPVKEVSIKRAAYGWHGQGDDGNGNYAGLGQVDTMERFVNPDGRNKRDVWHINTSSNKYAHFATFPKALITPCVLAGCPVGGTVLDCFAGSGTVAVVSELNNRNSIGIELNPAYIEIANQRMRNEAGHVQVTMFDKKEETE